MPATVQGILAERIDRLSARQKELLQILAVIGRKSSIGLIREVASGAKAQLDLTLAELEAAEFVYRQRGLIENDYIFKHALTQEVAYNSLLIERRKLLHETRRSSDGVKARRQGWRPTQPSRASLLAQRQRRQGRSNIWRRAGQQAIQRSAHAEAISDLRAAIRLVETLPNSSEHVKQEARLQLALGVSLQAVKGYGSDDVVEAYGRARVLSEQIGDDLQLVAALRGEFIHTTARQL